VSEPVKLGYFAQPIHPLTRDYFGILNENLEAVILADQLGYDEAFFGEHFTDLSEPITSALMFVARLIPVTKTIRLGSMTTNLPVYHPVMLAGQVAMIDQLAEGRFIWGIGPGGQPSDIEVFGNLDVDRGAMMLEAFDQIIEIWNGDIPYDQRGEFWSFTTSQTFFPEIGQGIAPKPLVRPHPPVVVTALAPHSAGITKAAERGWTPISSNYVQGHWVATHLPKLLEGQKNAGAPEDPSVWRVAKSVFVADDARIADEYARSVQGPYGYYYSSIMQKLGRGGRKDLFAAYPGQDEAEITVEQSLATQVIAGTVSEVVDGLLEFRNEVGPFGTLVYTAHDWADPVLGRRSMTLMAEEVMPRFNAALK
jgi:alkanesulfonate monooxygenase SsuD/methylene tetrahydromethanopterin reductase-like flavin-dependent oxidoreductase (luciferase family)